MFDPSGKKVFNIFNIVMASGGHRLFKSNAVYYCNGTTDIKRNDFININAAKKFANSHSEPIFKKVQHSTFRTLLYLSNLKVHAAMNETQTPL